MTRIAVVLCALLAACDLGDASNGASKTDGGNGGDGSGSGGIDAAPIAAHNHTAPVNAGEPTNAGTDCQSANCHGVPQGTNAPRFGFSGTVMNASIGGTPVVGVTVSVGALTAMTDTGGNFYTYTTTITYPATTNVAGGGKTANMSAQINVGDCNSSSCHLAGSTQGAVFLQ